MERGEKEGWRGEMRGMGKGEEGGWGGEEKKGGIGRGEEKGEGRRGKGEREGREVNTDIQSTYVHIHILYIRMYMRTVCTVYKFSIIHICMYVRTGWTYVHT